MTPLRSPVTRLVSRPRPFGLFSSFYSGAGLQLVPGGDPSGLDWGNGIAVDAGLGRPTVRLLDQCDNTKIITLTADTQPASGWIADAFVVDAYDDCASTFGFFREDPEKRVLAILDSVTQKAIERELWDGALRSAAGLDSRHLATSSATTVSGSALKVPQAIALLDEALASVWPDEVGVIHAPVAVASASSVGGRHVMVDSYAQGDLDVETAALIGGDKRWLETGGGNCLVSGAGYTGTGPSGQTPSAGQEWIYATGPVGWTISRAEVYPDRLDQATDVSKNTMQFRASRIAVVGYDGPVFAALVDLTGDYS